MCQCVIEKQASTWYQALLLTVALIFFCSGVSLASSMTRLAREPRSTGSVGRRAVVCTADVDVGGGSADGVGAVRTVDADAAEAREEREGLDGRSACVSRLGTCKRMHAQRRVIGVFCVCV